MASALAVLDQATLAAVSRRGHGLIEVREGRLRQVRRRLWARRASRLEVALLGRWWHAHRPGDRCCVYYNQPRSCPNYLVVGYVVSHAQTRLATLRGAARVLDEIARLKGADALLCDVANARISDRLLRRWGWEPFSGGRRRQFIKRFYGTYPPPDPPLMAVLAPAGSPAV